MITLHGHDETVARWIMERMGGVCVLPYRALGIIDGAGVLRGGFLLSFHQPTTADLTVYAPDALTHGTVRSFFRWAFGEAGVWRLEIMTTRSNKVVKKGVAKMGFEFESKARDYYARGVDGLRYAMTADTCRWTNGKSL